jgi:hypothetical protein
VRKKQKFSLEERLVIGATVTIGASVIGAIIVSPLLLGALHSAIGWTANDHKLFPTFLFSAFAVMALFVSWVVWRVGNRLGGQGSYGWTLTATFLSVVVAFVSLVWLEATYLHRPWPVSVIIGTLIVGSLFIPIAGYEISSHKRRQRRNYSVGISPVLAPGPAASMRVEGAALAIRGAF